MTFVGDEHLVCKESEYLCRSLGSLLQFELSGSICGKRRLGCRRLTGLRSDQRTFDARYPFGVMAHISSKAMAS